MRLVARNRRGQGLDYIGSLPAPNASALRAVWRGIEGGNSVVASRLAQQTLQEAQRAGAWIACNCLGENAENPPILFPRKLPQGRYTIVRASDRAGHAVECPFFWEEGTLSGHSGIGVSRRNDPPQFLLPRRACAEELLDAGGGKAPSVEDQLRATLTWLIETAGLNRWHEEVQIRDQLQSVRDAVKEVSLAPGVRLGDWLWTNPRWLLEGWGASKFASTWRANAVPQGWFVSYANRVDFVSRTFDVAGLTVIVGGQLLGKRDGADCGGPYLVVAQVIPDPANGIAIPVALAVPCLYHRLVPVDASQERGCAGVLQRVVASVAERYGVTVEIEKPLTDIDVEGGLVRPSFILHRGAERLVVDSVAVAGKEVAAQRSFKHATLRGIGPVFVDDRSDGHDAEAGMRLRRFVFGWLRALGALDALHSGAEPASAHE